MKKNYLKTAGSLLKLSLSDEGISAFRHLQKINGKIVAATLMLLLTTATAFAQGAYCIPAPTNVSGSGITNFTLGSINNTTTTEAGNYGNYTAQSATIGQYVTQTFSITVTSTSSHNTKLWVDWNNDFDFDDEGEEILTSNSININTQTVTGTVTVPGTAPLGNHRLRVGAALLGRGAPLATPCYTGFNASYEDYTINVTIPPTCFVPIAPTATNVNTGTINISWTTPVHGGTPVGYEYAVDTSAAPPATGTAVTGTTATNITVPAITGYIHVRSNCGDGDYSEWSTAPYSNTVCIPNTSFVSNDGITNVTIGSINNTTGLEAGNYGDFSAQIASIGQGVTQPFSITLTTNDTYNTKIWVDWNNDLDFDDAGEEIYDGTSLITPVYTINSAFTVPATAPLGNHRLRVGTAISWTAPVNPCTSRDNAAFEDYTINVTTPPSCYSPTNVAGTTVAAGTVNLSWTAPSLGDSPANYEYAVTATATPPATGTATTATTVSNVTVTQNATSYIHVRTNCGNGDYSTWYTVPYYNGYCTPSTNFADGTGITNVTISTINNTTELEETNYGNFSTMAAIIGQGVNQPFSITLNTNSSYNILIWIDWNNDLDFDDEGEQVYSGTSQNGEVSIVNGYFSVPLNATLGNHRLRIGAVNWEMPQACQLGGGGAYEDYTITVGTPPSCFTPTNFTAQIVGAGLNNLSWTAPVNGGTPVGYEYAVTAVAAPPAAGTAVTGTTVTNVSVTVNTTSYLHVRTNCGNGDFSEWVNLPFYNGVCIPHPTYINGNGITNFTTGTINNTTTEREIGDYGDFSAQITNIGQGVTQQFSISLNVYTAHNVKIWADWNDDLDFDDAGEQIYAGVSANTEVTTLRGNFTVPATASLGNHRVRIGISPDYQEQPTPCATDVNGAYEDYTINVTTPPSCFTPIDPMATAVAQNTANLSWTAPVPGDTPVGYQYIVDTNSTNPTVAGTAATTTSVTGYTGLIDNTYYYLHVRTNCGDGDFSQWVTSDRFKYLAGDTCETAINLGNESGSLTSTTVDATNNYSSLCTANNTAADLFYYIDVPNGYTVSMGQINNIDTYDPTIYMGYGGACPGETPLICTDVEDRDITTWENISGDTVRVYWVQDGFASSSAGSFTLTWTLTPPASCDRPRALTANITSLTSAVVSWNIPNTGTAVGYEYAVTASDVAPESGTYTTAISATVTTLIPNTLSYLHVRTICSEADGASTWVTYEFFSGYCVPTNPDSTEYYITGVSTTNADANFNNTSTGFSAYTDYTSQHSVTSYAGGSFNMQAIASTSEEYLYSVWIDWNNDFDFEDTGERVINTAYVTSPASLGLVTIPTTVAIGTYRMRVRNARFGAPVPACGDQGSGEAEDYTVNIVAAPACFQPFNPSITPTDAGFANLNWGVPQLGGLPTGYEYVLSTTSTAPTGNGTAVATNFAGDVAYNPAQSVYLFVRSICGANEHSIWVSSSILSTNAPDFLANSVIVYKENSTINITAQNTLITGIAIYDTRGRKLYNQASVNNTETAITGLQIQQQVVIVEVTTEKGKVSKRIIF